MNLDRKSFGKGMALLASAFPGTSLEKQTMDVYFERLKDFSPKHFERAVLHHIDTGKWFPKIAELREYLIEASRWHKKTAGEVWHGLIKAAEQCQTPEMDVLTERALASACGSFENLGMMKYSELPYAFNRFKEVYSMLEKSNHEDMQLEAPQYELKMIEEI